MTPSPRGTWRPIFALLLFFVLMLSAMAALGVVAGGSEAKGVRVYGLVFFETPEDRAALRGAGVLTLHDYGSFALVPLTGGSEEALRARGLRVVSGERLTHLHLGSYAFDPVAGLPKLPPEFVRDVEPPSRSTCIVQFIGPVRPEWLAGLRSVGATPGEYLPNNAFLVRMERGVRGLVASWPEVRWVGPYHPAFRLSGNLQGATGGVDVNILIFRDDEATAIVDLGRVLGELGASVLGLTRLGPYDVVRARVSAADIPTLAGLPSVYWIERYAPASLHNRYIPPILQAAAVGLVDNSTADGSPANVPIWFRGLTGSGEIVGLSDTGIDYDHVAFRQSSSTVGTPGPNHRKIYAYHISPGGDDHDNDVSGHGTHVANILAGDAAAIGGTGPDLRGNAFRARISFTDLAGPSDELSGLTPDLYDLFWMNYLDGARVISNSWGTGPPPGADPYTGGFYTSDAWSADNLSWAYRDILLVYSAGNSGPEEGTTSSPATAKDTLAVGATWDYSYMNYVARFSARGPTQDGRIKPDVMAPGLGYVFPQYPAINSADSDGSLTTRNSGIIGISGTSMSAPAVAGAGVLVRQYYRDGHYPTGAATLGNGFLPSGALLKATLINSAREMTSAGGCVDCAHNRPWDNLTSTYYPNNDQGFGRVTLDDALYFPGDARRLYVLDDHRGLTTGQAVEVDLQISSSALLKLTLVWTDAPGSLAGGRTLVNDLDLEVTEVSSRNLYRGNVYYPGNINTATSAGSIPNPLTLADALNNVEQVQINAPAPGTYRIRVRASNVPVGPQPFALVATGGLAAGAGILTLDSPAYGEGSTVNLHLEDLDAINPVVTLSSRSEPLGDTVALKPLGRGVWTAALPTTLDPPAPDGRISVAHGDTTTATYRDGSLTTVASAYVDLSYPVVNPVVATATAGAATIRFTTSKATSTVVRWGVTTALEGAAVVDRHLRTSHSIVLNKLAPETTYLFNLEVTDEFGHSVRDDRGGRYHRVTTAPLGDILLVDGSHATVLAVATYEADLASRGWTFATWDVATQGAPTLATLQAHLAVVWEVGDNYPPFTKGEMDLLKAYLDAGGRLLLASHDVAWAFGDTRTSPYATPGTVSWLASVLKATWSTDVSDFPDRLIYGVSGDPISGAYAAGAPYATFRPGGAGDEVSPVQAGGTTVGVWYASTRLSSPVGVRWTSSSPNGTAGQGVWGGRPSRLSSYFFEPFRINPGDGSGPQRRDILDRTLQWLVERDHPDASLLKPVAGEIITTTSYTVTWSVTTIGTARTNLYYSSDSGASWDLLTSTSATSFQWDLSPLPNGPAYRLRLAVRDAGSPSLQALTDGPPFSVGIPGHDTQGPLVRPGSLGVSPNPGIAGSSLVVSATVDEAYTSGSRIAAAELFFDTTGTSGQGIPMLPTAGTAYGTLVTMGVVWPGTLSLGAGDHRVLVHAMDEAGNWGPFDGLPFQVNLARSLRDFPEPFLVGGTFQATVVLGNSQPHNGLGASSTIDVVGAIPLAGAMGTRSGSGFLPARLDLEVVSADGTQLFLGGNIITIGGRGVNAVTRIFNQTLPAHMENNRGICFLGSDTCYRITTNPTTGARAEYAYISLAWTGGRYVMGIAGLSGFSTRAASQLLAQGALPLAGVALVLRFDDLGGDGTFESYRVQEVVQGVADRLDRPYPAAPPARQTFVVGLSSVHGPLGGFASTIDVVGGVSIASVSARVQAQSPWAVLDIEVAEYNADLRTVVVKPSGDLVALGGRGSNLVTYAYNSSLPVRFENFRGICVAATGNCYKRSGSYGNGTAVVDYALASIYYDVVERRNIEVIAGLSGFASRGAMVALASGVVARTSSGVVMQLQDSNGDGNYESVAVVEASP